MKKVFLLTIFMIGALLMSCAKKDQNPFFTEYDTPFKTPPFEKIKNEHYMPAFKEGIKKHNEEIDKIINNKTEADFENTIVALDNSGQLLTKVSSVFFNLTEANSNDEIKKVEKEVAPMLSKHRDDIFLNQDLFKRIKSVYDKKDALNLNKEQMMVLKEYYNDFVRGGANLAEDKKEAFRNINEELSMLYIQFGENVQNDNNAFELVINNKEDLAGLSESIIAGAKSEAEARGYNDKWVFTIDKPSMIPFLQYSEKRELREKIFKAYINKGDNNNENDNKEILSKIASLRVKRANLLGFETHADYVLADNMAKTPENVYKLLNQLWDPALEKAKEEAKDIQAMIEKDGHDFELKPWDWWYYAEKVKQEKYDLDENELRPYFKLENVRRGAFDVANKLFGIEIKKINNIQVYHPDVETFEVTDSDGSHIGILYTDYFPRSSKRGGAWMNAYRKQKEGIRPVIVNVGNFSKPTGTDPSLLSLDEVNTLFHEFGHALHGLLSKCTYDKVSGTSVARDFVELPSQIMENWATHPEVLKMYAKHYKTGEAIPDELIEKIQESSQFNQGFATVEYLAASFLDMNWHTLKEAKELDATKFENESLAKIGLIPEIVVRYRSTYFNHIFSGSSYSSGYYSYVWAEVLDADAFAAFKETDVFDKEKAAKFRENILAAGGTDDPMEQYKRFRGQEPDVKALIERRGLN